MDDDTTVRDDSERSTDPTRFAPRASTAKVERHLGEIVGSGAALLALLVGVPVVLLVLAGAPPIPTSAPSLRDFAQQLSFEDILAVLVAIVWLTWLWFVVLVVVEVLAARRGGLARSMPLGGPLQRLARVLVGALLLTGIMAGQAQAVTDAPGQSTTSASAMTFADAELAPVPVADVHDSAAVADEGDQDMVGKKVYTVKAPKNGYHDNLWDIAEKHLGDGRRYHEIYELNKDHVQADGLKIELARLIQPGWELEMPDDAVGVERMVAPVQEAPAPVAPDQAPGDAVDETSSADAADVAVDDQRTGWMTGIGLLAASVIGALAIHRRRGTGRRPDGDALALEAGLTVAASAARVARLDHVLRSLTATCREAGVNPPPAYGAIVDDESVELLLTPAQDEAVTGWEVLDGGRRWRTEALVDGPAPSEPVPYPALVGLGVDPDGRDVMVDLESAGGIVAVTGDPGVAEQVAAAVAVQAATAPWSETVRVIAADLPDGIAEVGDARLRVADLADELDGFEQQIDAWRDGVLTGRVGRRSSSTSQLVVSGRVPRPEVADRLGALTGAGRQAFSVLVAGDHQGARWRLQVDEHGTLSVPLLGLTLTANRVTSAQVEAVAELFAAARDEDRPEDGERVAIPEPLRPHDDSAWATASRRVGVLGVLSVQGAGALADERADLATELVAYLAMHPEGVHPTVLAGALWPRGVTADVRDATIERTRSWLGTAVDGSHVLRADADGRLSLYDGVVCDWDCARTLFLRARRVGSQREEAELLRRGLQLARGRAFATVPPGRYGWVAQEDVSRTVTRVVVDAALRLVDLLATEDPAGAAQAAQAGLRVSPGDQRLWRALIRARHQDTGVAGVQQTLTEMVDGIGTAPLEAETEALVNELMPDVGTFATGS